MKKSYLKFYDYVEDKVICQICGCKFKSLVSHIFTHGLNCSEYRKRFDLFRGSLCNRSIKNQRIENITQNKKLYSDLFYKNIKPSKGKIPGRMSQHYRNLLKIDNPLMHNKNLTKEAIQDYHNSPEAKEGYQKISDAAFKKRIILNCKQCKIEYRVPSYRRLISKFCTKDCKNKFYKKIKGVT